MARSLAMILAVVLSGIGAAISPFVEVALAQQFPASAVIRGENIRVRLEPAEVTEDVAILQRGDQVTITGAVTSADGLAFYPVEVVQTGDAGWVRDLFINPRSIVPIDAPVPALEPVPDAEPAPDASEEDGNNQRRERPARQNRQNREAAAEDEVAAEDEAAAEEDAAAADQAAADEAAADDEAAANEEAAEGAATEPVATAAGVGTARSERFALEPGRYRLTAAMEVTESGRFTCEIFGPEEFTETLFDERINEPQSWTAQTRLRLESGGDFYVECSNADGDWTIEFVPA